MSKKIMSHRFVFKRQVNEVHFQKFNSNNINRGEILTSVPNCEKYWHLVDTRQRATLQKTYCRITPLAQYFGPSWPPQNKTNYFKDVLATWMPWQPRWLTGVTSCGEKGEGLEKRDTWFRGQKFHLSNVPEISHNVSDKQTECDWNQCVQYESITLLHVLFLMVFFLFLLILKQQVPC